MNESVRRYVVAYDIHEDKRRAVVSKCLQSYGYRAQYSVYITDMKPVRMRRLVVQLEKVISQNEDSIMIFDLGLLSAAKTGCLKQLGRRWDDSSGQPLIF